MRCGNGLEFLYVLREERMGITYSDVLLIGWVMGVAYKGLCQKRRNEIESLGKLENGK